MTGVPPVSRMISAAVEDPGTAASQVAPSRVRLQVGDQLPADRTAAAPSEPAALPAPGSTARAAAGRVIAAGARPCGERPGRA
ncbi:MAG: hypothetical protein ACLP8X_43585 [Streptosporangiaceae bacterium]